MFSSILAAIAAIPKLLEAVQQLLAWFQKASDEAWFAKEKEVVNHEIPAAQTQEEFLKAAKDLQDVTKGL